MIPIVNTCLIFLLKNLACEKLKQNHTVPSHVGTDARIFLKICINEIDSDDLDLCITKFNDFKCEYRDHARFRF